MHRHSGLNDGCGGGFIPGLYPLVALPSTRYDNQKRLQTLHVPWWAQGTDPGCELLWGPGSDSKTPPPLAT